MMKKSDAAKVDSASRRIDARIEELDDWRARCWRGCER